jgi:hypothetical protein
MLDPLDVLLIVLVLAIAYSLLSDDDEGGKRDRLPLPA